jgi:hypothetical protein
VDQVGEVTGPRPGTAGHDQARAADLSQQPQLGAGQQVGVIDEHHAAAPVCDAGRGPVGDDLEPGIAVGLGQRAQESGLAVAAGSHDGQPQRRTGVVLDRREQPTRLFRRYRTSRHRTLAHFPAPNLIRQTIVKLFQKGGA